MNQTEQVLDFAVHLSRGMLEAGANLERVSISIQRLCKTYHLTEVSIFVINSMISVSAKDETGDSYVRQGAAPISGIQLAKLRKLNRLVHRIMHEKPRPEELQDLLYECLMMPGYSTVTTICGYILAMVCLCKIFGGSWQDMIVVSLNTVGLYFITGVFSREKLNRIIANVIAMFFCGCMAILFVTVGFAQHLSSIIITNAFYLIPGIPMVNAFRNIICGNELNGIIEMVKVLLEVVTIVAGLYIACLVFGPGAPALFGI